MRRAVGRARRRGDQQHPPRHGDNPGRDAVVRISSRMRSAARFGMRIVNTTATMTDILVWQATTRDMNPTVPQSWIDTQLAKDPARASADYLAQFSSDLEGFISREAVMACVVPGLRERPPDRRVRHHAFVDPSGGSTDSFTLCIGHNDIARRTVILDCHPRGEGAVLSPKRWCRSSVALMKTYNVLVDQRRPLRQGMAGRELPPSRHPLHPRRPAQIRPLRRQPAAIDQLAAASSCSTCRR